MRPGINPRKRPRPNRWLRRQTGVNLYKLIMNLFPATSWKDEFPLFEGGTGGNTGLIWANVTEPPVNVGRMDIEYLKTGIFKDHPIVNRDMGRSLLWGHIAEPPPPIPDLVRHYPVFEVEPLELEDEAIRGNAVYPYERLKFIGLTILKDPFYDR